MDGLCELVKGKNYGNGRFHHSYEKIFKWATVDILLQQLRSASKSRYSNVYRQQMMEGHASRSSDKAVGTENGVSSLIIKREKAESHAINRSRRNLLNRKRSSIVDSLSLSTSHRPDMTDILLKRS